MAAHSSELNLARKWRPQTFDAMVGQTLSLRMLKNSLFLQKFFPVYIFSGQRGCGKTTSARIFAAAINCAKYQDFIAQPRDVALPCGTCFSCSATRAGNHPDFIEIDAASHTGVDNVRTILESATHAPLLSSRKVYLIDEVHMLSKAAFNAFLKMLEEPPASVIFILATTELDKIPDTVKSRSFQVFFDPIAPADLVKYLTSVCTAEHIAIDAPAIELIVQNASGSARDAINLLERVRFLGEQITRELVANALGHVRSDHLFELFRLVSAQDTGALIHYLREIHIETKDPSVFWDHFVQLLRAILWTQYGALVPQGPFELEMPAVKTLGSLSSAHRVSAMMQIMWHEEPVFIKTGHKHLFIEHVLILLCQQVKSEDIATLLAACKSLSTSDLFAQQSSRAPQAAVHVLPKETIVAPVNPPHLVQSVPTAPTEVISEQLTPEDPQMRDLKTSWQAFITQVRLLSDPMLESILSQATLIALESTTGVLRVALAQSSKFFEDHIAGNRARIESVIETVFGGRYWFAFEVKTKTNTAHSAQNMVKSVQEPLPAAQNVPKTRSNAPVNFNDATLFPKAALITKYFPGRIEQITNDEKNLENT